MRPPSARAMAASTWFHGSAWPPGYHGTMPLGSCHSAMPSTVACTSAAVMTPSTSGTVMSATDGLRDLGRLAGVEHQALAQHGVEGLLGPAGQLGGLHDVPGEELQVGLDQRVVVVGGADG